MNLQKDKKKVAKTGVRTLDSYENGVQVKELLQWRLVTAALGRKIKGVSYKTIALTTRPSWLLIASRFSAIVLYTAYEAMRPLFYERCGTGHTVTIWSSRQCPLLDGPRQVIELHNIRPLSVLFDAGEVILVICMIFSQNRMCCWADGSSVIACSK